MGEEVYCRWFRKASQIFDSGVYALIPLRDRNGFVSTCQLLVGTFISHKKSEVTICESSQGLRLSHSQIIPRGLNEILSARLWFDTLVGQTPFAFVGFPRMAGQCPRRCFSRRPQCQLMTTSSGSTAPECSPLTQRSLPWFMPGRI